MGVLVDLYEILLLVACIGCAMSATSIFVRDPDEAMNRYASLIVLGGAWWAFCEIQWNRADDPDVAMTWVKLSALGWVTVGPLGLQLLLEMAGRQTRKVRWLLQLLYGSAVMFLVVDWTTSWIHVGMVKTSWGWSYELGPAYLSFYVFAIVSLIGGLSVVGFDMRSWASQGERAQGRGLMLGIMVPLTVASVTDGILPLFDIHVWHLGTASIALLGGIVNWTFHRYGYSLLAPGTFAKEILETMPDGLALLHLDGRIRRVNPAMLELAGVDDANEIFGRPIGELLDGEVLGPGEIHHEVEMRMHSRQGGMPTPVAVSTRILRNRLDETTGVVVVCRDLREVTSLRQRVLIGGRMAAVGQLAAGVAHELNNPMAYVRSNVTQLLKHWERQRRSTKPIDGAADTDEIWDEGIELITETIEGIERASSIVRDIKMFSHGGNADREVTSLARLLDATVRIASPHLRHRARVVRTGAEVPVVHCAPREIQQVFLNLLINAVDASRDRGDGDGGELAEIEIDTQADARDVYVRFTDHGEGISPDCLECIFDPFFTTKPAGEGTGLGLALSYEIVRKHGGDLRVESQPGVGSSFTVVLPHGGPDAA